MSVQPPNYSYDLELILEFGDEIFEYHGNGYRYLALQPQHGVVAAEADFSDLQAWLADLRASERKRVQVIDSHLYVWGGKR